MTPQTGEPDWSARYRSVAGDEPTPQLDQKILAVAARHAHRVRVARRGVVAVAIAAVGVMTLIPLWWTNASHPASPARSTGYGLEEGATRDYLAHIAGNPYSGPGSIQDQL